MRIGGLASLSDDCAVNMALWCEVLNTVLADASGSNRPSRRFIDEQFAPLLKITKQQAEDALQGRGREPPALDPVWRGWAFEIYVLIWDAAVDSIRRLAQPTGRRVGDSWVGALCDQLHRLGSATAVNYFLQ